MTVSRHPERHQLTPTRRRFRAIKERLCLAGLQDQFVFKQEHAVRVTDLQDVLLDDQPHIVHCSGHGSSTRKIILENPLSQSKAATASVLKDLFATLKHNIPCVVLNACYSERGPGQGDR